MSQSKSGSPLVNLYAQRIGTPTNDDEVLGYWLFFIGVLLGFLGLLAFFVTDPATTERGIGYALAAVAPPLFLLGAVLRFPLRRMATYLAGLGTLISIAAVVWFLLIFPDGWSLTLGDTGVIITYVTGLAVTGIAGAFVPLATPRVEEVDVAAAAPTEAAGEEPSKARFELYQDKQDEWRWRLVHRNGNIIADSGEGYTSKANAEKGMRSVKRNAPGAETTEA